MNDLMIFAGILALLYGTWLLGGLALICIVAGLLLMLSGLIRIYIAWQQRQQVR